MSEEDDDYDEELQPDIPNILIVLEDALKDFDDTPDWTKMSKKDLMTNIYNLYDALRDVAKYLIATAYKLDILDRAHAAHITAAEDGISEDIPETIQPEDFYT